MDPRLEALLAGRLHRSTFEVSLALDPGTAQHLLHELTVRSQSMAAEGLSPLLLTAAEVRLPLKRFFEGSLPRLVVLAYQELPPQLDVQAVGIIQLPRTAVEVPAGAGMGK